MFYLFSITTELGNNHYVYIYNHIDPSACEKIPNPSLALYRNLKVYIYRFDPLLTILEFPMVRKLADYAPKNDFDIEN